MAYINSWRIQRKISLFFLDVKFSYTLNTDGNFLSNICYYLSNSTFPRKDLWVLFPFVFSLRHIQCWFEILAHSIYLIWLSGSYNIPSFFLGLPKTSKFWTIIKRFVCNLLHIQTEGPIVFSGSAKNSIAGSLEGTEVMNTKFTIQMDFVFQKRFSASVFCEEIQTDRFFSCWFKYFFKPSLYLSQGL